MRWIPKGMTVEYLKKARGTMHAVATPDIPIVESAAGYDLPVTVLVRDPQDDAVFRARIAMWLSPKYAASSTPIASSAGSACAKKMRLVDGRRAVEPGDHHAGQEEQFELARTGRYAVQQSCGEEAVVEALVGGQHLRLFGLVR